MVKRLGQASHQVGVGMVRTVFPRAGTAACSRKTGWEKGNFNALVPGLSGEELWLEC